MASALALNCTLSSSPADSSTQKMIDEVFAALATHDVKGDTVRVVDHDVRPGVLADMGDGDEWPRIRQRMLDADILLFATPTWVGHASSVAQRVLERLDAELSESPPTTFGKVAVVAVVGNEDGAHKIVADVFQGLNDMGFSIPAQGSVYWNGEAMQGVDYKDLDAVPDPIAATTATLAANAAHLSRLLTERPYPS